MKNWKTTVAGLAGGALNLYANGVDIHQIVFSIAIAVLGAMAKDRNVTHSDGTIPHTVGENEQHIRGGIQ